MIALCLESGTYFFWRGPGLLLVSRSGISDILRRLAQQGLRVIGMEAFEVDNLVIHPRLDLIFDADRRLDSKTAQEVIDTWPDDVWIDVTIGLP